MLKENIVLDTNCLVMSLSSRNKYSEIWHKFVRGEYILCVFPFPKVTVFTLLEFMSVLRNWNRGVVN